MCNIKDIEIGSWWWCKYGRVEIDYITDEGDVFFYGDKSRYGEKHFEDFIKEFVPYSDSNHLKEIKIGDEVVVADNSRSTYRSSVYKVVVVDIVHTAKTTKWYLSDNTAVMSEDRMYKL